MQDIPDHSIDLPYGTTACKWDVIIPFDKLWGQYKRIVKSKGAIVLFGSEPFSSMLRMSNLAWYKYDWIWDKVRPSGFQIAKYRPMQRHEIVSIFAESTPTWYPIKTPRDKPVKGKVYNQSESSPLKNSDGVLRTYTDSNPQSIIPFYKQSDGAYIHPTQKPVALLEYLIRTYTQEGETILDNTAGSGSLGVAAINTNRNAILIERNDLYFDVMSKRISKAQEEKALSLCL
jgi:site-specific DNA-methyltransferase (adenine-specific)